MARLISHHDLDEFLLAQQKKYQVFAPVFKDGEAVFAEYEKGQKLALDYPVTVLPPKKYLLPPTDTLFEYKDGKTTVPKIKPRMIFGVSYEDLEGIYLLEKIFEYPVKDEVFAEKAQNSLVIALDRFSPPSKITYDLYFQKVNPDLYACFAGTKRGVAILKSEPFFTKQIAVPRVSKSKDPLLLDPDLPKIITAAKNHPVWKELAEICFGCGICSYACPLCYCFEVEDQNQFEQNEITGKRCRTWDSCMLTHFAQTTSHNFRPELQDRIYNWYFHKFVRMPKEHGFVGCVDCNRCVVYCPAKISYRKVLERLVRESKGEKSENTHLSAAKK